MDVGLAHDEDEIKTSAQRLETLAAVAYRQWCQSRRPARRAEPRPASSDGRKDGQRHRRTDWPSWELAVTGRPHTKLATTSCRPAACTPNQRQDRLHSAIGLAGQTIRWLDAGQLMLLLQPTCASYRQVHHHHKRRYKRPVWWPMMTKSGSPCWPHVLSMETCFSPNFAN